VLAIPPANQSTITVSAVEFRLLLRIFAFAGVDGYPAAKAPSVAVEAVEMKSLRFKLVFILYV
jgi:hypothetical protein